MERVICTLVAAATIAASSSATTIAQGGGGKNVVVVDNTTDGRTASRAGVVLGRGALPDLNPENLASATSSCTDCRTVAVALQAVIIVTDPDSIRPNNVAAATNAGCTGCRTFAFAFQYVVASEVAVGDRRRDRPAPWRQGRPRPGRPEQGDSCRLLGADL